MSAITLGPIEKAIFLGFSYSATVLTVVETVNSFHSNLQIFITYFVITTNKNFTAKVIFSHYLHSRWFFLQSEKAMMIFS